MIFVIILCQRVLLSLSVAVPEVCLVNQAPTSVTRRFWPVGADNPQRGYKAQSWRRVVTTGVARVKALIAPKLCEVVGLPLRSELLPIIQAPKEAGLVRECQKLKWHFSGAGGCQHSQRNLKMCTPVSRCKTSGSAFGRTDFSWIFFPHFCAGKRVKTTTAKYLQDSPPQLLARLRDNGHYLAQGQKSCSTGPCNYKDYNDYCSQRENENCERPGD